jgi:RNA polymerase sigma-70 factor (ECF subfamily)
MSFASINRCASPIQAPFAPGQLTTGKIVTDEKDKPGELVDPTSSSLLARVRAREDAAWEKLVCLYGPLVYSWCRRAGLQPADAADVGQNVFVAVSRSIENFRHDRAGDSFRAWLFTIARRKICDHWSARGAEATGAAEVQKRIEELAVEESSVSAASIPSEDTRALYRRAIELVRSEFEPATWDAFWKVTVEDQPPAEVALALGISRNAVYLAKSHVKRRLREEFDALLDFKEP